MNTCKADPFEYFSLYQKTFINSQLNKMDEKSKALIIKKITQFSLNLVEICELII